MKLWWTILYIVFIINFIAMVYCVRADIDVETITFIMSSCLTALGVAALWVIIFGIRKILNDYLKQERDRKIAEIIKRKEAEEDSIDEE